MRGSSAVRSWILRPACCAVFAFVQSVTSVALLQAVDGEALTHPEMRPLPLASQRDHTDGPSRYVDGKVGDDSADGSQDRPWKTIQTGLDRLKPGETLYIAGGVYHEHLDVRASGTEEKPITVRAMKGSLVIVDGGLREFLEDPASAWIETEGGVQGEFISAATYPQFAARPILNSFLAAGWEPFHGKEAQRPVVQGAFADSMVPLHGYRVLRDLQDDSMLWDVTDKFDEEEGVYCGPGVWFNRKTHRIHIRLAHTNLAGLGERAYRGPTDPRMVPLVISGPYGADVLRINGVGHVLIQDLVFRGASASPLINIHGAQQIRLEGVTVYGGSPGLLVKSTHRLQLLDCAFRGLAAPWSSRASMKYRGTPSYTIITQRNQPLNSDFEFARCEFTDDHDFAWIRYVKNLRFHHNFVDNYNDDGLEVGARRGDHELYIYQNWISRCALTFTLHQMERDESPAETDPGSGVFIMRNVIDLRHGLFKTPPRQPDKSGEYLRQGATLVGDHGSPTWPNYYFYHNTVLRADRSWRGYYGFGMGGRALADGRRQVLNNIFLQVEGVPGLNFSGPGGEVMVDGNFHWGLNDGPGYDGDFFAREGKTYAFRGRELPSDWLLHDRFVDPGLRRFSLSDLDPRLSSDSAAVNAGVEVKSEWLDPLRGEDAGSPDVGAIPLGVTPWRFGIRGRLEM